MEHITQGISENEMFSIRHDLLCTDMYKEVCVTKTIYLMIRWTLIFLMIALIAAVFGFGGIAAGAAAIAKVIFFIAIIIFLLSLIAGGFRRG